MLLNSRLALLSVFQPQDLVKCPRHTVPDEVMTFSLQYGMALCASITPYMYEHLYVSSALQPLQD